MIRRDIRDLTYDFKGCRIGVMEVMQEVFHDRVSLGYCGV
jgi:hypothetical protein